MFWPNSIEPCVILVRFPVQLKAENILRRLAAVSAVFAWQRWSMGRGSGLCGVSVAALPGSRSLSPPFGRVSFARKSLFERVFDICARF